MSPNLNHRAVIAVVAPAKLFPLFLVREELRYLAGSYQVVVKGGARIAVTVTATDHDDPPNACDVERLTGAVLAALGRCAPRF